MASADGTRKVLRNVSWSAFERYLASKGEAVVPRITYLDGVLELMTPSREHESRKSWIGSLVEVYAMERRIIMSGVGSWTLKDKLKRAGAEPDECYIIGDDKGRRTRPHFVIEVQWSRRGIKKLEVYKRLGVREVWFWPKQKSTTGIEVYVLRKGEWKLAPRSSYLPGLDLELMCSFLGRPAMITAMLDFRAALAKLT